MADARRAAPLPPDERRAAILSAVLPLLREVGPRVSTRELAAAAGVAEGTLFRAFPDKRELLRAAALMATDPSPLLADLAQIDLDLPLAERVEAVVCLLTDVLDDIMALMALMQEVVREDLIAHGPEPHQEQLAQINEVVLAAIAVVLEPDRASLRLPPEQAAAVIQSVVAGGRMPGHSPTMEIPSGVLTEVLLGGLRA